MSIKQLQNVRRSVNLVRNMGLKYVLFRGKHEMLLRSGLYKSRFPVNGTAPATPSVEQWRASKPAFFFDSKRTVNMDRRPDESLKLKYQNLVGGRVTFFGKQLIDLGIDHDWRTNPDSGFTYAKDLHWTQVADFNEKAGDIKYVWEKSRFTFLYDIIRYDYHFDQDCFTHFAREIESWIDNNPVNCGPNYVSSQEIALRVLNWLFALNYYSEHSALTDDLFRKIIRSIYWQVKHVFDNINFSRLAVRNNHAVTESLCLFVCGVLLPFFPEANKWKVKGKQWLEEEIEYQVYEDGTYLQFSMNYHRVVIQLMNWGIRIAELNDIPLRSVVYDRAEASVHFLFNCMNLADGRLPNYGPNDGSLFFPLNNNDYTDFRPQLHALSVTCGKGGIEEYNEDEHWYGIESTGSIRRQQTGTLTFNDGGFYLLRDMNTFTFIRCGKHKDRPTHADNLHIDIWVDGENILRDSGSYKYNADEETRDYFMGTASHNTVLAGNHSQMLRGARFIWFYWSQAITAGWKENDDEYCFEGAINAFTFIDSKAIHKRKIVKKKGENKWTVTDVIENLPGIVKKQVWHHDLRAVTFDSTADGMIAEKHRCKSYNSLYYGSRENGEATCFEFDSNIVTNIIYRQPS